MISENEWNRIKTQRILVCGTHRKSMLVAQIMSDMGGEISCFIDDSNMKYGNCISGIPVVPADYSGTEYEKCVAVAAYKLENFAQIIGGFPIVCKELVDMSESANGLVPTFYYSNNQNYVETNFLNAGILSVPICPIPKTYIWGNVVFIDGWMLPFKKDYTIEVECGDSCYEVKRRERKDVTRSYPYYESGEAGFYTVLLANGEKNEINVRFFCSDNLVKEYKLTCEYQPFLETWNAIVSSRSPSEMLQWILERRMFYDSCKEILADLARDCLTQMGYQERLIVYNAFYYNGCFVEDDIDGLLVVSERLLCSDECANQYIEWTKSHWRVYLECLDGYYNLCVKSWETLSFDNKLSLLQIMSYLGLLGKGYDKCNGDNERELLQEIVESGLNDHKKIKSFLKWSMENWRVFLGFSKAFSDSCRDSWNKLSYDEKLKTLQIMYYLHEKSENNEPNIDNRLLEDVLCIALEADNIEYEFKNWNREYWRSLYSQNGFFETICWKGWHDLSFDGKLKRVQQLYNLGLLGENNDECPGENERRKLLECVVDGMVASVMDQEGKIASIYDMLRQNEDKNHRISGIFSKEYTKETKNGGLSLLFVITGGIGDAIMELCFYERLIELVPEITIDIYGETYCKYIYGSKRGIRRIIDCKLEKAKMEDYDVVLQASWGITVYYVDEERVSLRSKELLDCIKKTQYDMRAEGDLSNRIRRAQILKKDKFWLMGRGEIWSLSRKNIKVDMLEEYEQDFRDLNLGKYITINHGVDMRKVGIDQSPTKVWPSEYFEKYINDFKDSYKGIEIIQLGDNNQEPIRGADRYIFGQNFEVVKYIIKNSMLHVDDEGGLVHLATALGTKCIVMFGPTPIDILGYDENINVCANACPGCFSYVSDWNAKCILGNKEAKCMYSIKPHLIMEKTRSYLDGILKGE